MVFNDNLGRNRYIAEIKYRVIKFNFNFAFVKARKKMRIKKT